jgi:hypothetical protein
VNAARSSLFAFSNRRFYRIFKPALTLFFVAVFGVGRCPDFVVMPATAFGQKCK